ncbi:MAG TPA: non-canonical purine NTP pyrophosphatase [Gammaproteobacteria bacterium]|nr:non-canonical purine NTP pyrophosphatase [Gammaproteobacteria bacterium]
MADHKIYHLNTSNPNKLKEFKVLFKEEGIDLQVSNHDLKEIVASPIRVVIQKASQLDKNVIVEDTSLEIEGEEVGINVRWLLDNLTKFEGKKAVWTVLLAYQKEDGLVYVYQGQVKGVIVKPKGKGFGFDPFFKPDGSDFTLAELKPNSVNARAIAVKKFTKDEAIASEYPILSWEGDWQHDD